MDYNLKNYKYQWMERSWDAKKKMYGSNIRAWLYIRSERLMIIVLPKFKAEWVQCVCFNVLRGQGIPKNNWKENYVILLYQACFLWGIIKGWYEIREIRLEIMSRTRLLISWLSSSQPSFEVGGSSWKGPYRRRKAVVCAIVDPACFPLC